MSDLIRYHGDSKVINRLCELINNMTSINFEVVQVLPTQDISTSTIYLVPKQTAQTENIYDEYINTDGTSQGWELIGTTEIDLTNYVQFSDLSAVATSGDYDDLIDKPTIPTDFVPKSTGGTFEGDLRIEKTNTGTTNVNSVLRLGNDKAVGVLGNTRGVIQIYDRNGNYTNIFASDNASSGNVYLPNDKPTNSVLAIVGEAIDWESNGKIGAKNLNSYPYYEDSKSGSGITWTVNSDGTIKAMGKATAQVTLTCHYRSPSSNNPLFVKNGNYILNGCPSGGANNKYRIAVTRTYNGANNSYGDDIGEGLSFTINGDDYSNEGVYLRIVCVIANNYDCGVNGLIFKPMLRIAEDLDDTFQPYAMTNQQLTEVVKGVPSNSGTYTLQATRDANGNVTYSWV